MKHIASCISSSYPPLNRQRGAIGVLAAVVLGIAVMFSVLALDTGRLYWEGQELQRIADMAALDAATANPELFTGELLATVEANPLKTSAEASVTRNIKHMAGWTITTTANQGAIPTTADIRNFCKHDSCEEDVNFYNAVEVTVTKNTCTSIIANLEALLPGYSAPQRSNGDTCMTPAFSMSRSAAANRTAYVAFSAGTSLLKILSEESSLLAPLFGDLLAVGAVGYEGLADLYLNSVTLRELLDLLGLTLDDLDDNGNNPDEVKLSNIINKLGVSEIVNEILDLSPVNEILFQLRDILAVTVSSNNRDLALDTEINIGTLVNAALLASLAEGIDLNGDVGPLSVTLDIVQPPVIAVGPVGCETGEPPLCTTWRTEARPAQIDLSASLNESILGLLDIELNLGTEMVAGVAGISSISPAEGGFDLLVAGRTNLLALSELKVEAVFLPSPPEECGGLLGLTCITLTVDWDKNHTPPSPGTQTGNANACLTSSACSPVHWPSTAGDSVLVPLSSSLSDTTLDPVKELIGGLNISFDTQKSSGLIGSLLSDLLGGLTGLLSGITGLVGLPNDEGDLLSFLATEVLGELDAILDDTLAPLLKELGISVNTMDVEILNVQAGAPELAI